MPKRRRSRSLARKGTSAAAAERRRRQEDAQQRVSRLALARLAPSLASNLQVPLWCQQGSVVEAQSSERRRRSLSKECRSSQARLWRASLLVYTYR